MSSFSGFPPPALAFFAGLQADNSKAYWQENKPAWETKVHAPMLAFLDALPAEMQPFRLFRMHRDVRFAKDKSPYKTQTGAVSETVGGAINYVHLSMDGLLAASGQYMMARDQLERYRQAVADDRHGPALEAILATLAGNGLTLGPGAEAPLKTVPRGYPKDHPRIERPRWKGVGVRTEIDDPALLQSPALVDRVTAFWRETAPLNQWLDTHVGPSTAPPERRDR